MERKIALISTRLKFADGVSVEAEKWLQIFAALGFRFVRVAGEIKDLEPNDFVIPELSFEHPEIVEIQRSFFEPHAGGTDQDKQLLERISVIKDNIKSNLMKILLGNKVDLLCIENAISLPMNIPLGIALSEVIEQAGIPTIARHHDFFWERDTFSRPAIPLLLEKYFPPDSPLIHHVVINSLAQEGLAKRKGIVASLIHNSFDFTRARSIDEFNCDFRSSFGIGDKSALFLQPTRIIRRKRIERSILLLQKLCALGLKDAVLLVTSPAETSEKDYFDFLLRYAKKAGVRCVFADHPLPQKRGWCDGKKLYEIYDAYACSDFVTLPSDLEGFGNPVIEACMHKKPVFVNRYPTLRDITSKGFRFVQIDEEVTDKAAQEVLELLEDGAKREAVVERNFELARRCFSLESVKPKLAEIISKLTGIEVRAHASQKKRPG